MSSFIGTHVKTVKADGVEVFYREAGPAEASTILLLHGYPSSSFQFRNLIPILATKYHVVAPDLPGYGFTVVPDERSYKYTFESFAKTIGAFVDVLGIKKFIVYIFDYGAPTGLRYVLVLPLSTSRDLQSVLITLFYRLALERPDSITAIISQNGNAYDEGLGSFWDPVRVLWKDGFTEETLKGVASFTSYDGIKWQVCSAFLFLCMSQDADKSTYIAVH